MNRDEKAFSERDKERLRVALYLFRLNWSMRHDRSCYRHPRIHLHMARKAVSELRFLTCRPTKKRNVPWQYGQQGGA